MSKSFYSLGLMSGTSGDGVDASIIQSNGDTQYKVISDKYFEYNNDIYQSLFELKDKINNHEDFQNSIKEQKKLENKITLFHADVVNKIINDSKIEIDLIGFHGQTIYHNFNKKISKQLGDGKLLAKLSKKRVICDFRKNDLENGGQGAPLTPIFHESLRDKIYSNSIPVIFINLGGIANVTCFHAINKFDELMFAKDIGPGNCLIDEWIRKNSKKKYDKNGLIAKSGKTNELILNQALDNFEGTFHNSLDIKDFDISFARGLSLEDGASTITNFTVEIITTSLKKLLDKNKFNSGDYFFPNIVVCGGGRKNNYFVDLLRKKILEKI